MTDEQEDEICSFHLPTLGGWLWILAVDAVALTVILLLIHYRHAIYGVWEMLWGI